MSQMVTRCPKCATAFRVTSTQLESAKGAVRCGSCLHIFKAQDYLVTSAMPHASATISTPLPPLTAANTSVKKIDTPASPVSKPVSAKVATSEPAKPSSRPTPATEAKPVFDKAKALADEEDILISDDMDKPTKKESTYEFDGFLDIDLHPKQTVSLFEREIKDTPDEEAEQTDESWAEQLLDDTDEPVQPPKKNSPPPTSAIESPVAPPEQKDIAAGAITTPDAGAKVETKSNPLVFSLVSDSDGESEPMFSDEFLRATNANDADTPVETAESDSYASALFKEELDNQPVAKRPAKSHKIRAFDSSRTALLMNIMPAPVEFTAKRMRHWYQRKLWPSLALLMALLLIFQIAYFKFDYFSRVEPYRTVYLLACPLFKCKVPTLVDTQKIVATNLIVRNHPTAEHALMVDAILINNAPFEQPFPDLLLAFSTLDEKPIAARRFTPKEYLGGELAGMDHIPQRQPVHITLELADPGPEAVNYHLSIP